MNSGASYVNAGYLSPGHIIPLAAPGVIKQGLKWMFNSSSPFYIGLGKCRFFQMVICI